MGFAGLQLIERGHGGLGLQAALVDLLAGQHAFLVEAHDTLGFVLGLLGGGGLLVDLGAQQGIVQLHQRLALPDPGPLFHIDLGDAVAGEVGADRGLLAGDQQARGR